MCFAGFSIIGAGRKCSASTINLPLVARDLTKARLSFRGASKRRTTVRNCAHLRISRFRARCCASPRNDGEQYHPTASKLGIPCPQKRWKIKTIGARHAVELKVEPHAGRHLLGRKLPSLTDAIMWGSILSEWLGLIFRWLHVVAAIGWIGSSFYFIHLDLSLKPSGELPEGVQGEAWQVHGGGFYRIVKYLVAPAKLPDEL